MSLTVNIIVARCRGDEARSCQANHSVASRARLKIIEDAAVSRSRALPPHRSPRVTQGGQTAPPPRHLWQAATRRQGRHSLACCQGSFIAQFVGVGLRLFACYAPERTRAIYYVKSSMARADSLQCGPCRAGLSATELPAPSPDNRGRRRLARRRYGLGLALFQTSTAQFRARNRPHLNLR